MSYLALYRKYRPSGFDSVIGQDHIVKTLTRQIETGRIGHAYLFCGSRGTGKTSTARIFAKAINCQHPINGSPCGTCETCKGLDNPANLDIVEIDAASNNRVDEIRTLRETVTFPPTVGKYKVYIIDEVHMLTDQAFNALLKTLEEPPSFAVFILATTESYKVPATILSRCMRFDFRLIAEEEIANNIKKIYDDLGKKYEEEAIHAIAKAGNGSMRDALSVADVCVSYGEGVLKYSDVLEVLGSSDKTGLYNLVSDILSSETGNALVKVNDLVTKGKGIGVINSDVIAMLRDLFVVKVCNNYNSILHLPKIEAETLESISKLANKEKIMRAIELFSSIEGELKYTTHPRVSFETAVIRASMPETDWNIDALLTRITQLESQVENGEFTIKNARSVPIQQTVVEKAIIQTPTVEEKKQEQVVEPMIGVIPKRELEPQKMTAEEFYADIKKTKNLCDAKPIELLGYLNRRLRQEKHTMLWAICQNLKLNIKENTLTIFTETDGDKVVLEREGNISILKGILEEYGDINIVVKVAGDMASKKEIEDGIDEIQRIFGNIVRTD